MDECTVTLRDDDAELATRLVAEGRYSSADAVVRAAMDALRDEVVIDHVLDAPGVRAAVGEGEAALARGDYVDLGSAAELNAHLDGIMARVETDVRGLPAKS
jgi:Arc/MetJ-type ribon-helix-helix transcriptional regulator